MYLPRKRSFWAVGLGHFTNDTFMAMGVVLLTFLSASVLPMTNTQIGLAISSRQLIGSIGQPLLGIRADRTGGRWLGSGSIVLGVGSFMLTILLAVTTRNYFLMLIPFLIQGLGSAAIHPVGMLHAAKADDRRVASNMSYFFFLGQTGLALGPALIGILLDAANSGTLLPYNQLLGVPGAYISAVNVTPIFLLAVFAVPVVYLLATNIPPRASMPKAEKSEEKSDAEQAETSKQRVAIWPFVVIGVLVMLRGLGQPGAVPFIPVLFQQKGWTAAEYGLITSSFWIASGISGIIFGNLADRYDRRMVVMISMLLSAPAFFFLPVVDGVMAFALALAAGAFSGGSHSIIVVLAQELVPQSKGFASGAILGFIFGTGALGSLIIGNVSDAIGLNATFQLVAGAVVLGAFFALLLPKNRE